MTKESQNKIIRKVLETRKFVSRNWALKHYITRLAARIRDLKDAGMKIVGSRDGNDYLYVLNS